MESHLNIYCKIITSFSSICPNKNLMLYFDCIWVYGNPYHASDPRRKINRKIYSILYHVKTPMMTVLNKVIKIGRMKKVYGDSYRARDLFKSFILRHLSRQQ